MQANAGTPDVAAIRDYFVRLQADIAAALADADGAAFRRDEWERAAGGGGISMSLENGRVLERAGVLFSHVTGAALPASATAQRPHLAGREWEALGVSLVVHPRNPYAPTVHLNVRHFAAGAGAGAAARDELAADAGAAARDEVAADDAAPAAVGGLAAPDAARAAAGESAPAWWFGGGMDLTPVYGFVEDARHFHATCRDALAPFGAGLYPRFKRNCDEYFFLGHRQEARGIGGIFYDDFNAGGFERAFALTRSVGDHFVAAYLPILARRRDVAFGQRERDFQAYRRGRYVEFNLVCDRGTLFGLQSKGRTEAILLSLPPLAAWRYDWSPEPGSPEARLYTDFLPARDWIE